MSLRKAVVRPLALAGLTLLGLGIAAPSTFAAPGAPHAFDLTYRSFGRITADSGFRSGTGYAVRFEGCYAKHSEEAICGFTLRATRPLIVTNLGNLAHGAGVDGSPMRTCCLFVQGDERGYPITKAAGPSTGVAVLSQPLRPGQEVGLMLRVPNYRAASPLAAITFARGEGDQGQTFPAHVLELP